MNYNTKYTRSMNGLYKIEGDSVDCLELTTNNATIKNNLSVKNNATINGTTTTNILNVTGNITQTDPNPVALGYDTIGSNITTIASSTGYSAYCPVNNCIYLFSLLSATTNCTIYNITTGVLSTLSLGASRQIRTATYSPYSNKIYARSVGTTEMVVVNCATNAITTITLSGSNIDWEGGAYCSTTKEIVYIPRQGTSILIINTTNDTARYVTPGTGFGSDKFLGSVYSPSTNRVYGIPFMSAYVCYYDVATSTAYPTAWLHGLGAGGYWFNGGVCASNGKIYCPVWNATTMLVIDPATNTSSQPSGLTMSRLCLEGISSPYNNKLYFAQLSSTDMVCVDTTTNTYTTIPMIYSNYGYSCVIDTNYNIYVAPQSATGPLLALKMLYTSPTSQLGPTTINGTLTIPSYSDIKATLDNFTATLTDITYSTNLTTINNNVVVGGTNPINIYAETPSNGATGTTDNGINLININAVGGGFQGGIISEVGSIVSLGINAPQTGTRLSYAQGGLFRFDTGTYTGGPLFSIITYDAGATTTYKIPFIIKSNGQATITNNFGASSTPSLIINDSTGSKNIFCLPNLTAGSYNNIVQAGDIAIVGAGSAVNNSTLTLTCWSNTANGTGIRITSTATQIKNANITFTDGTTLTTATTLINNDKHLRDVDCIDFLPSTATIKTSNYNYNTCVMNTQASAINSANIYFMAVKVTAGETYTGIVCYPNASSTLTCYLCEGNGTFPLAKIRETAATANTTNGVINIPFAYLGTWTATTSEVKFIGIKSSATIAHIGQASTVYRNFGYNGTYTFNQGIVPFFYCAGAFPALGNYAKTDSFTTASVGLWCGLY